MKFKLTSILVLPTVTTLLLGSVRAAHHESGKADSGDSDLETITVEYRDSLDDIHEPRYNAMFNDTDRFYYFKRNFEKAFKKEKWPVRFEFKRFPINVPEDATVVEITFLSFKSPNRIELELRMWAKLNVGGEENDFGVKRIRHLPNPIYSSGTIDRDLHEMYTEVADEVVNDLKESLFKEK